MRRPLVGIGLLGTTLDAGFGAKRWDRWRPTVSVFQHDDLLVDRYELLHPPSHTELARRVAADIAELSPETQVVLHPFPMPDPWDFAQVYAALHDFARAYPFDTEREDYLVHISTGSHVAQICLFLLTEARHLPGRLLQTAPPSGRDENGRYSLIDLDLSTYDLLASRFREVATEAISVLKQGIETRSPAFNTMIERVEKVATVSSDPILLEGPTGAGKSRLASRIYELRRARHRVKGPLVEVNCATLRGDQAMSALFGHAKGAFTGAVAARAGLLRSADTGMLFLDEIGELGLDEQAMLLRAIETKSFFPMGADREVTSDFQLVCGTNRDLRSCVREGRFREDLLARIDLWTFRLPALRDRIEDLEPNLEHELLRAADRLGRKATLSKEARAAYLRFATSREATWAGNFRDLSASVLRMATLAEGGRIDVAGVQEEIERLRSAWSLPPHGATAEAELTLRVLGRRRASSLDRFDRVQLEDVLRVCASSASLSEAGRTLFAESRKTKQSTNDADRLRKYLARFELAFDEVKAELGSEAGPEAPMRAP